MNKLVLQFFLIVSVGALIGWFTNYLAIKLLFRPYKEIRLLFFKIQGLIPKRKDEIVENIAEVVEKELISISDITEKMQNEKIDESVIDGLLDKIVGEKLQKKILEKNPLLKMFVNDSMIDKMKSYFKKTILENKEEIVAEIVKIAEEKINIREIMIENMRNFSSEEMERIILTVSKNELKHIEIIGGILGGTIAIFQFLLMLLLNKIK